MITVGVSIVVRGIALLTWGSSPYSLPDFTEGPPLDIFGAAVSLQRVWIVVTAALCPVAPLFSAGTHAAG